jgi:GxxExxY protein
MHSPIPLIHEKLTREIIGAFFDVYYELGFGFLESVYAAALDVELERRGLRVEREKWVTVHYKDVPVSLQRVDRIVDDKILLELKATAQLSGVAKRITYNYLRATSYEVGLVLHFGLEPKFHRLVHSHPDL